MFVGVEFAIDREYDDGGRSDGDRYDATLGFDGRKRNAEGLAVALDAEYDGSVMVERTKGIISARCDKEPANFLAINLAHDIVTEERSVEEARQAYGEIMQRLMEGDEPDYTQGFQFEVPDASETGDPDEAIM